MKSVFKSKIARSRKQLSRSEVDSAYALIGVGNNGSGRRVPSEELQYSLNLALKRFRLRIEWIEATAGQGESVWSYLEEVIACVVVIDELREKLAWEKKVEGWAKRDAERKGGAL